MATPELITSGPLSSEIVDSYDLKVRRGKKFRSVSARAIFGANDGRPMIQLGHFEVESISGGGALDAQTARVLEIQPTNIAIRPEGESLRVYNLPE